jgi:hypothetical protein
LNKAPWGGLYTPAVGRVRQADCHHLYNYETVAFTSVSRDTLQPELKPSKDLLPIAPMSSPAIANTHVGGSRFLI